MISNFFIIYMVFPHTSKTKNALVINIKHLHNVQPFQYPNRRRVEVVNRL